MSDEKKKENRKPVSDEVAVEEYRGFLRYRGIVRLEVIGEGKERKVEARGRNGRSIHLSATENDYILAGLDAGMRQYKKRKSLKQLVKAKFREIEKKAAEKIYENLKKIVGLGTKDESKLCGITREQRGDVNKILESPESCLSRGKRVQALERVAQSAKLLRKIREGGQQ